VLLIGLLTAAVISNSPKLWGADRARPAPALVEA
jgi:hypothetical protein